MPRLWRWSFNSISSLPSHASIQINLYPNQNDPLLSSPNVTSRRQNIDAPRPGELASLKALGEGPTARRRDSHASQTHRSGILPDVPCFSGANPALDSSHVEPTGAG